MRVEAASNQPCTMQCALRGESDEQLPTPVHIVSQQRRVITVSQKRSEGWWTGDGEPQHVGWITNLGAEELRYTVTLWLRRLDKIPVPQRSTTVVIGSG